MNSSSGFKACRFFSPCLLGLIALISVILPNSAFATCTTLLAPGADGSLCATDGTSASSVTVNWTDPNDYFDYTLFRHATVGTTCAPNQPGCSGWTQIYQTYNDNGNFVDTAPIEGKAYLYWLCYRSGASASLFCMSGWTVKGWRAPPPAPTTLTATDGTLDDKVQLNWNGSDLPAINYKLYRSTFFSQCSNGGQPLPNVPTQEAFNDTTATPGVSYYYSVEEVSPSGITGQCKSGETGWRNMLPPTNVVAQSTGPLTITVSWNHPVASGAPSNGVTSYVVYRKTNSSSNVCDTGIQLGEASATNPTYADSNGLEPGKTYYYAVRSKGANADLSVCSTVGSASDATVDGFTISGTVTKNSSGGSGLSGATVAAGGKTTTTNSGGAFTLSGYLAGNYTLTASKAGVIMNPSSQSVNISSFNISGISIIATCPDGQQFSGNVCQDIAPNTPTGLQATDGMAGGNILITWNAPIGGGNVSQYLIYRNATCSGTPLAQSSATSFTDTTTTPGTTYFYTVKAQNGGGTSACSNSDSGYSVQQLQITQQPSNQMIPVGTPANFSVVASGTGQLNYQWMKNGSDIAGATSSSYGIAAVSSSDSGSGFSVRITDGIGGQITSQTATLTVMSAKILTSVQKNTGGGLSGAIVSLNGSAIGSTDAQGEILSQYLVPGSYTVTAQKNGVTISPPNLVINVSANNTAAANFTASCGSGQGFNGSNCENIVILPITPNSACVQSTGPGQYRAYFGYNNTNAQPIALPIQSSGNDLNYFAPGAIDRGQGTVFQAGQHAGVFSVDFDGTPLTWTIKVPAQPQVSVTISSNSPGCAPVTPKANCVSIGSAGGLEAHFDYVSPHQFEGGFKIAVGTDNAISPAPIDRGQPTNFLGGTVVNAFSVPFGSGSITWTLQGVPVSVSATSPVCAPGNQAPVAKLPSANIVGQCQGVVNKIVLDGTQSSDANGNLLSYLWTTTCPNSAFDSATSATPTLFLDDPAMGTAVACSVTLQVSDGLSTSTASATVSFAGCVLDCLGAPNGSTMIDQCGVCGGDGSTCLDCNNVPYGSAKVDGCGVCEGKGACLDCSGVANGTNKPDQCGVCGGDGTSCLGCVQTDISPLLTVLTRDLLKLRDINSRSLRRLRDSYPKDKKISKQVTKQLKAVDFRYTQLQVELYAKLPPTIVNCTNLTLCVQNDNGSLIDEYRKLTDTMRKNTKAAVKAMKKRANATDKKRAKNADKLHDSIIAKFAEVPRLTSNCSL